MWGSMSEAITKQIYETRAVFSWFFIPCLNYDVFQDHVANQATNLYYSQSSLPYARTTIYMPQKTY